MRYDDDPELGQYLSTNVRHEDKWFFVSTINRLDSTDYPTTFSETMIWEWDKKENKRGKCIGEFSGCRSSSTVHFMVVNNLLTEGKWDDL